VREEGPFHLIQGRRADYRIREPPQKLIGQATEEKRERRFLSKFDQSQRRGLGKSKKLTTGRTKIFIGHQLRGRLELGEEGKLRLIKRKTPFSRKTTEGKANRLTVPAQKKIFS